MIKKTLLAMALLLGTGILHAQYNLPQSRIWAMGNRVGLDFTNPASPTPITTNLQNSNEAAASICDTGGRMLFYTNGTVIWNKAGGQMPNGASLIGATGSTRSTTQGAAIVPVPDSAGKYYVFSLTEGTNCRLFCNMIDMSLDSGRGDVVTGFALRGTQLNNVGLTEKMTVVTGCGNSVWLMVHEYNTQVFRAYHITPAGINLTPVVSTIGHFPGGHYAQGVMKFSPLRNRMLNCNFRANAAANAGVEVFDFDYTTGVLSNGVLLDSTSCYGGAFSADGSKVYAGSTAVMNRGSIAQFDLGATDPKASKTVLGPCGQYTDFKLGPDAKIYFGALAGGAGYSNYRFMGRINDPNLAGTACNFKDSLTSLMFPHPTSATAGALTQGMPNDVAVPVQGLFVTRRSLDTTICRSFSPIVLRAPGGYDYQVWSTGDSSLTKLASARGVYWVRSGSDCDVRVDTFVINGVNMPVLGITRNAQVLTATTGFQSYQWYRNDSLLGSATGASYIIDRDGAYSVKGIFGAGCSDSAGITVFTPAAVGQYPLAAQIRVYPNPAGASLNISVPVAANAMIFSLDGRLVLSADTPAAVATGGLASGSYMLRLTDAAGRKLAPERLIQVLH